MSGDETSVTRFGKHVIRFEPPDIFRIDLVGSVTDADMARIGEEFRRADGDFFMVIDAKEMGVFSGDAKKAIRDIPMSAGIAVFGAGAATRVVLSILNKVYMMVNRGANNPVEFCETEAQARAWVDRQRSANKSA